MLIGATYGGGTGLATQRECLEALGCYGKGQVNRLAEIVAGVALAGEISLGAAISGPQPTKSSAATGDAPSRRGGLAFRRRNAALAYLHAALR